MWIQRAAVDDGALHRDATSQLFMVERYDDSGTPGRLQPLPPPSADVLLMCAVCIPADDVVLALVQGSDEQTVSAGLAAAGWRVDRITPATWAPRIEDGS